MLCNVAPMRWKKIVDKILPYIIHYSESLQVYIDVGPEILEIQFFWTLRSYRSEPLQPRFCHICALQDLTDTETCHLCNCVYALTLMYKWCSFTFNLWPIISDLGYLFYRNEVKNRFLHTDLPAQQVLQDLWRKFHENPAVRYASPVSSSLGRQIHLHFDVCDEDQLQMTDVTDEMMGSALVICNSTDREEWDIERDDALYVLETQLRMKVSHPVCSGHC